MNVQQHVQGSVKTKKERRGVGFEPTLAPPPKTLYTGMRACMHACMYVCMYVNKRLLVLLQIRNTEQEKEEEERSSSCHGEDVWACVWWRSWNPSLWERWLLQHLLGLRRYLCLLPRLPLLLAAVQQPLQVSLSLSLTFSYVPFLWLCLFCQKKKIKKKEEARRRR